MHSKAIGKNQARNGKSYLNAIHKTSLHPIDCCATVQMHCFDESSPVAAIGLGISDVVLCAQDEIAICAKVGFRDPYRTVLALLALGFDLNACHVLLCEVLSEKLLPGFEILDSA